MESEDWENLTLGELIEEVCRRPELYVGDRSFRSAAQFIDGFAAGRGDKERSELKRFNQWVAYLCWPKRRWPQNLAWFWYVEQLYPSDDDAFDALSRLYNQFLAQDSVNQG